MKTPIYPCIWFKDNAKEAASYYCSIFNDSRITSDNPMVVMFESAGQKFMCLNGGPQFTVNPSISFFVVCESLDEIDKYWQKLSQGGSELMPLEKYDWSEKYGWIQDKFGVSWQLSLGNMKDVGQKFSPSFLFTGENFGNAEKAVLYYTSIFERSDVVGILKYPEEDKSLKGKVMHAQFSLESTVFMAMDSHLPHKFNFNEGISMVISCDDQKEIDYYWSKLTEGGKESMCGWLKDKFGVSWQVVPSMLGQLMSHPEKGQKVMQAFLKMRKFDIATLLNV